MKPVADTGEGPGAPQFLDQTEARRAEKFLGGDLRVWMTATPPPPSPLPFPLISSSGCGTGNRLTFPFKLKRGACKTLRQPRPQGFSLKKWVGPTHFLREKPWGRG